MGEEWVEVSRDVNVIVQRLDGSEQYRFLSALDGKTVIASLKFHEGDVAEGINGVTVTSLLEIAINRLTRERDSGISGVEITYPLESLTEARSGLYATYLP